MQMSTNPHHAEQHPTIDIILRPLQPHRDRFLMRGLDEVGLRRLEDDIGRTIPPCLRAYLGTVGLFQDVVPDLYGSTEQLRGGLNRILELAPAAPTDLFPLFSDSGDPVAVHRVPTARCDRLVRIESENGSVEDVMDFCTWLSEMVQDAEADASERPHNATKTWRVQFSFQTPSERPILEALAEAASVEKESNPWEDTGVSRAGVATARLVVTWDGRPLELRRQEYRNWKTPSYCFDLSEPATVPAERSRILELDRLFRTRPLGYRLVDYGPIPGADAEGATPNEDPGGDEP